MGRYAFVMNREAPFARLVLSLKWANKLLRKEIWRRSPAQLHDVFMSSKVFSDSVEAVIHGLRSEGNVGARAGGGILFPAFYDSGPRLRELVGRLVRDFDISVVVETGVAHGHLTRVILEAFTESPKRKRVLHSIDVDPRTRHKDLEDRADWRFHLIDESRSLESVFEDIGLCDLFVHDSDHGYENQFREYSVAWDHLRPGGFLVSDDVNWSNAFLDFCTVRNLEPLILSDTTKISGILRKDAD
jgi:hypothetical protein